MSVDNSQKGNKSTKQADGVFRSKKIKHDPQAESARARAQAGEGSGHA